MARRLGALRRTRLRGASLVLGLAGLFAALGLAGCADVESTVRTTVSFGEARASAGATVDLIVGSCNGDPEVTALEQTADEVRVEVTSTVPAPGWGGDGCLDPLTVALDAPLGDRVLVDMNSGNVVEVYPVGS